ncbi:hypothetical protein RRF57_008043 [Xylaria bambusicola]|uniref:Uncharacterized protein n=1 Tax=Xylaria bambusicola TaxID=326684 RepID=A0AAN7Z0B6_9PEZI
MSALPSFTATALPPELPPAEYFSSGCALWTDSKADVVECVPIPNSSIPAFPTTSMPWLRSCVTMVAAKGISVPARMLEAHVV